MSRNFAITASTRHILEAATRHGYLRRQLRLLRDDAEWLRTQLLNAALWSDATQAEEDEYGRRYVLDFHCERHQRRVTVRSGWIIRQAEDFPRLTACYNLCLSGPAQQSVD